MRDAITIDPSLQPRPRSRDATLTTDSSLQPRPRSRDATLTTDSSLQPTPRSRDATLTTDSPLQPRPRSTDRVDASHEGLREVVDDLFSGQRAGGHHVGYEVHLVPRG